MIPFDVYPLLPVKPVKAAGCYLWDDRGTRYLDLYGGHAVISIGHSHPHYVQAVSAQVAKLGFYSNSVRNPLQEQLADYLGKLSGYEDYQLFLVNSGAEAVENVLKLASFHTGRSKIIAFRSAFHGRTSLALGVTDNPALQAPVNQVHEVIRLPLHDLAALEAALAGEEVAAVIVEGIQGIAGVYPVADDFLVQARALCDRYGTLLVLDEVQSGYGRSGRFFAHQYSGIKADLITVGKGMGNGFPLAGVLIAPHIKPRHGLLGTTFGGNHLACAAGLAVLQVIQEENLLTNSQQVGKYLMHELQKLPVREVRGRGLMIAIEMAQPVATIRKKLLHDYRVFTGSAARPEVLRLLPPLCLSRQQADIFVQALGSVLASEP